MASDLNSLICSTIDARSSDLNDISQSIWNKPELCFEEHHAHELLTSFLENEGFKVERKTPLETSFIARYGDQSGLKVGILCEYDALPGVGHACGHNLIAEAGIGAALGIKAAIMSEKVTQVGLIVFGTPDEELVGGKVDMIVHGSFNDADICLMSHPAPYEVPIPIILADSDRTFIFHGRAGHPAFASSDGANALDAAVACYNHISMLRQQMKPTCRVHAVIQDGGLTASIIPERSEMELCIRGVTDDDTLELVERVEASARAAAMATGCTVTLQEDTNFSGAMKTNKILIDLYIENAKELGVLFADGEDCVGKMMVSTDMGNVSSVKPSIHPFFKIKTKGGNHTHKFTEATGHVDNQLPTLNSAKSMAMTAVDIMCNQDLMVDIKKEFEKSTG